MSIIVFYNAAKKKLLKFGSSDIYSTHPLLATIHAEDLLITEITKKWQYQYNINDLIILIWKQNAKQEIRPIFCCQWCKKRIIKSGFPTENVITISDYYMENLHKITTPSQLYTTDATSIQSFHTTHITDTISTDDSSDDTSSINSTDFQIITKNTKKKKKKIINMTDLFNKNNICQIAITDYVFRYPLMRIQNSIRPLKKKI